MTLQLKDLINTNVDIEVQGICFDSRVVKHGDLFVAIHDYRADGHQYAKAAVEGGAVCVVCEHPIDGLDVPQILVENGRRALAQISHKFYKEPLKKLKLVGVTGTNGKTSTAFITKTILEAQGEKCGLIGTAQNMIGDEALPSHCSTPEAPELASLFRQMVDAGCSYAVMEVSSHSLELDRVYGCTFEAAAFTNLTHDHLDFHGDMEHYFNAKTKLFSMCKHAVINLDDAYGQKLASMTKGDVLTYGTTQGDLQAQQVQYTPEGVQFNCLGTTMYIGIPGEFTVYNALAAIGLCRALGLSAQQIQEGLKKAHTVKGRVEVVPTGKNFTVIIDYAHTPDGLKNVLESVRPFVSGRLVVLFGCGGDRDKSKRPEMGKIAGALADLCIVTSDNPRTEEPAAIIREILDGMRDAVAEYVVVENRKDAIAFALRHAKDGDVIVLAGKGHETYQDIGGKKNHFDEREIVKDLLKQI